MSKAKLVGGVFEANDYSLDKRIDQVSEKDLMDYEFDERLETKLKALYYYEKYAENKKGLFSKIYKKYRMVRYKNYIYTKDFDKLKNRKIVLKDCVKDLEDVLKNYQIGDAHVHYFHEYLWQDESTNSLNQVLKIGFLLDLSVVFGVQHFYMNNLPNTVKYVNYFNEQMGKICEKLGAEFAGINFIPFCEVSLKDDKKNNIRGRHTLVSIMPLNERNALAAQKLSHKEINKNFTSLQMKDTYNDYNDGKEYIGPNKCRMHSSLKDTEMLLISAHPNTKRGGSEIMPGMEGTNTSAKLLNSNRGQELRDELGSDGPGDTGGSDAHCYKQIGTGLTLFPKSVDSPLDVKDSIINHETKIGYLSDYSKWIGYSRGLNPKQVITGLFWFFRPRKN
jgi:hypothetical protein